MEEGMARVPASRIFDTSKFVRIERGRPDGYRVMVDGQEIGHHKNLAQAKRCGLYVMRQLSQPHPSRVRGGVAV
jgi:hypothetical protein